MERIYKRFFLFVLFFGGFLLLVGGVGGIGGRSLLGGILISLVGALLLLIFGLITRPPDA
jgi:hypothetical protein